jgi:hypothetical protein
MQPRQIRDTSKPVRPSFTYSISQSPTIAIFNGRNYALDKVALSP